MLLNSRISENRKLSRNGLRREISSKPTSGQRRRSPALKA